MCCKCKIHTRVQELSMKNRMQIYDNFFYKFVFVFFFNLIYFLAALGLRCGARASHCSGFSCCGAWASVVVAHKLSSCGSQAQ